MYHAIIFYIKSKYMEILNNTMSAIFEDIVNPIVYAFSAFTFVYFLYGVFIFILARYNADKDGIDRGKRHMIWGIVGLVIVFSASSIYEFITGFFN